MDISQHGSSREPGSVCDYAKLTQSICRCGKVHTPGSALLPYIGTLHRTTEPFVASHGKFDRRATCLNVADYAMLERNVARAITLTALAGCIAKSMPKCKQTDLLQSLGNHDSSSSASLPAPSAPVETLDMRNLLHSGRQPLKSETSQEPSASDKTH